MLDCTEKGHEPVLLSSVSERDQFELSLLICITFGIAFGFQV